MGREFTDFRENVRLILEQFPGRGELRVHEAANFLGISARQFSDRYRGYVKFGSIGVNTLARVMCPECKQ